ncbi:hypothetical protein EXIGLDRAFT_749709 [Exidia glandulosa HHB12029]|uniref:Fe2OG dioxygenase domain-containing protein n=1 Tax=Exidia glandulosa HHB12029 TaxID=1314781 RepID=A0A165HSJ6_EXIGL|nr:hypothetical protein EXIGLDRAFT_749709 [Exidia glandulosa HHB12029]
MAAPASQPEHIAFAYLAVQKALGKGEKTGWTIKAQDHPLSSALAALRVDEVGSRYDRTLSAVKLVTLNNGASLGTIGSLKLPEVQALAVPSSFGKGAETVYDESVRKGTEVSADKLGFALEERISGSFTAKDIFKNVAEAVATALFPGQPVKLVFYKLAIYEPGGHFEKHRDTTHADSHHGTLLIGCTPEGATTPWEDDDNDDDDDDADEGVSYAYEGGQFSIHHSDGTSSKWPVRPDSWLAFYTDLEHSVAPVTKGVRLTLQFDIYLEDDTVERAHTVASVPATKREAEGKKLKNAGDSDDDEDDTDDEDDSDAHDESKLFLPPNGGRSADEPTVPTRIVPDRLADFVPKLVAFVRSMRKAGDDTRTKSGQAKAKRPRKKSNEPRTAVFLLHHLYRQQSLLPEYLKGIDKALYEALKEADPQLNIALHPVYINMSGDEYGESGEPWSQTMILARADASHVVKTIPQSIVFIRRPGVEASLLKMQEGAEYTGNESMPTEYSYFAGAMFLWFS